MSASLALEPAVLAFLREARLGRLATVDAAGRPAVIPICYQVERMRLFTPIDAKPKRGDWRRLQRVRNVLANPRVAVVVDRWDEDWSRLAWVHLRGHATLHESGVLHTQGIALLRAKYPQYRAMALEALPLIVIDITGVSGWGDIPATPVAHHV